MISRGLVMTLFDFEWLQRPKGRRGISVAACSLLSIWVGGCAETRMTELRRTLPNAPAGFEQVLATEYLSAAQDLGGSHSNSLEVWTMVERAESALAETPRTFANTDSWWISYFDRPGSRTLRNYAFAGVEILRDQDQISDAASLQVATEAFLAREQQFDRELANWAPGITDYPDITEQMLEDERVALTTLLARALYQAARIPIETSDLESADRYLVFFEHDRNSLGLFSRTLLAAVLDDSPESFSTVLVEGHTDTVGTELYNHSLSQRRTDSVAGALKGTWGSRIATTSMGEARPLQPTPDGVSAPRNRRATISFHK